MLRIRLRRVGKKKQPMYRIVVADSRSPRDGAFVEALGHYHPMNEPSVIVLDGERARHWLDKGAQPSDRVSKILAIQGIAPIPPKLQKRIELGKQRAAGAAKEKPKAEAPPAAEAAASPPTEAPPAADASARAPAEAAASAPPAAPPAAEASAPAPAEAEAAPEEPALADAASEDSAPADEAPVASDEPPSTEEPSEP